MKLGLAEIQAKKEIVLTQMNQEHELKMIHVQNYYAIIMRNLDTALETTRAEIAKETKDISGLIDIMKAQTEVSQIRSHFMLEQMDKTISQNMSDRISFGQTKGYLGSVANQLKVGNGLCQKKILIKEAITVS